jgi:ABC-2 type transport system ATP-binding protein
VHVEEYNRTRITIQNPEKDAGNKLLQEIIPLVDVLAFREIIPGMNDVFINAVKEDKSSNHNNE